jgi:hypothetical protein
MFRDPNKLQKSPLRNTGKKIVVKSPIANSLYPPVGLSQIKRGSYITLLHSNSSEQLSEAPPNTNHNHATEKARLNADLETSPAQTA